MVTLALNDNLDGAKKVHYAMLDIINALFMDGSPSGIKAMLSIMGICEDHVRLPLVKVNKVTHGLLEKLTAAYLREKGAVV